MHSNNGKKQLNKSFMKDKIAGFPQFLF